MKEKELQMANKDHLNRVKDIKVPTGDILIVEGERGSLECLSIGDYGKHANIKADFLGLKNEINGVPNGAVMPFYHNYNRNRYL
jgi:hypothetical protein